MSFATAARRLVPIAPLLALTVACSDPVEPRLPQPEEEPEPPKEGEQGYKAPTGSFQID